MDITLTRPLESVRGIYALQSQPHALRFDLLSMSIGHSPTFLKHEISYHSCCSSCLRDLGSSLPLEFVKRHVISGCSKNSPFVQIHQNQLSSFLRSVYLIDDSCHALENRQLALAKCLLLVNCLNGGGSTARPSSSSTRIYSSHSKRQLRPSAELCYFPSL